MTADVTYDGVTENNYTPVGNGSCPFKGMFDGNGHTVSGILISKSGNTDSDRYQGLFGHIGSGAEVKNVILVDATITGYSYTGSIVGRNNGGTISHCHTLASVNVNAVQDALYHGGIVGYNEGGTVSYCTSAANITGTSCEYCGGIVGYNRNNSNVSSCLYLGSTLEGSKSVGAIAGYNYITNNNSPKVENCYYTSTTIKGKGSDGATLRNAASAIGYPSVSTGLAPQDNADNSAFLTLLTQRNTDLTAVSRTTALSTAVTLTLNNRTLYKNGKWNTLCLPFEVDDFIGTPLEDAIVMTLDNSTGCHTGFNVGTNILTLDFVKADKIEAGRAYIVKWDVKTPNNVVNPTFTGVTISNEAPDNQSVISRDGYVKFIGTYNPVNIYNEEKTNLYLGDDNTLYYPWNENMTSYNVNAFRVYFQLLKGLTVSYSPTGIKKFVLKPEK